MHTGKGFALKLRKAALLLVWLVACLQLPSSHPELVWAALGGVIIYIGLQLATNSEQIPT